jgi:hypothetical protein
MKPSPKYCIPFLLVPAILLTGCGGNGGGIQDDVLEEQAPDPLEDISIDAPQENPGDSMEEPAPGDTVSDVPADPDAEEPGTGDEALLVWYLNGAEVARAEGAEASTTYLFLPYWGRNVQVYFTGYESIAPGTYGCNFMTGPVNVSLITSDNSYSHLENLPDRWKSLNIAYCDAAGTYPDAIDMWIRLDEIGSRLRGAYGCTIAGGGERAGETLTIDGTFDVAVPGL